MTRRVTLLMGLVRDFLGNFSTQGERYHFRLDGSMRGEIEPTGGEIETNLGNRKWGRLK